MIGHSIEKECEDCKKRDAEITGLKRQLQLVQAQVAIVDRGLGDLGDTNAQAVLDAHDADTRNRALEEAASLSYHMCGQEGSRMTCHTEDCPKCRILARK